MSTAGWKGYIDTEQKIAFYHHKEKNITQWERPSDFGAPNNLEYDNDATESEGEDENDYESESEDSNCDVKVPEEKQLLQMDENNPASSWTSTEAGDRVANIAPAFSKYKTLFYDNGVDGKSYINLTKNDLDDIGIENGFHKKKILKAVGNLQRLASNSEPSQLQIDEHNATCSWTSAEAGDHVANIAPAFSKYKSLFRDNGVDGESYISLTEQDLDDIGIVSGFHKKKILQAVQDLKRLAGTSKPSQCSDGEQHMEVDGGKGQDETGENDIGRDGEAVRNSSMENVNEEGAMQSQGNHENGDPRAAPRMSAKMKRKHSDTEEPTGSKLTKTNESGSKKSGYQSTSVTSQSTAATSQHTSARLQPTSPTFQSTSATTQSTSATSDENVEMANTDTTPPPRQDSPQQDQGPLMLSNKILLPDCQQKPKPDAKASQKGRVAHCGAVLKQKLFCVGLNDENGNPFPAVKHEDKLYAIVTPGSTFSVSWNTTRKARIVVAQIYLDGTDISPGRFFDLETNVCHSIKKGNSCYALKFAEAPHEEMNGNASDSKLDYNKQFGEMSIVFSVARRAKLKKDETASHGPASNGPAPYDPTPHDPPPHGTTSHGPDSRGSDSHGPASHGPASHGPASHGPASHGPASHGPASAAGPPETGISKAEAELPGTIPKPLILIERSKYWKSPSLRTVLGDKFPSPVQKRKKLGAAGLQSSHPVGAQHMGDQKVNAQQESSQKDNSQHDAIQQDIVDNTQQEGCENKKSSDDKKADKYVYHWDDKILKLTIFYETATILALRGILDPVGTRSHRRFFSNWKPTLKRKVPKNEYPKKKKIKQEPRCASVIIIE